LELKITDTAHPIMRNVPTLDLLDESYWLLTGDTKRIGLLATSQEDGLATPQLWTYEPGQGRVFVSIPGHYSWTFDDPIFRTVILRAMAWTAREPIDRFNELVRLGAPDETLSRLTVIPRFRTGKKNWKHRGTENTEGRQTEELCALCVSVFQNGC
jgi:hypothetical protein